MEKRYDETGQRLTDCCEAYSTYMDGELLCCKKCYREVELGQGDGSEYRPMTPTQIFAFPSAAARAAFIAALPPGVASATTRDADRWLVAVTN